MTTKFKLPRAVAWLGVAALGSIASAASPSTQPATPPSVPPSTQPAPMAIVQYGHPNPANGYQEMITVLSLDQDTQLKLSQIAAARRNEGDHFDGQHWTVLGNLRKQMDAAKLAKDDKAYKLAATQWGELSKERTKAIMAFDDQAVALLTPAQQDEWAYHQIYTDAMNPYKKLNLTNDQKAGIAKLVRDAYRPIAVLGETPARGRLVQDLRHGIQTQILTPEQLTELTTKTAAPTSQPGKK